jgi:outer membrane protein
MRGTLFFSPLRYSLHINFFIKANFMKTLIRQTLIGLCFGITLVSLSASAKNFETEQASEESAESEENFNGGFLKIGLGYKVEENPYNEGVNGVSLFVNGRYQWEGLFVEAFFGANERNEGLSIGYNFYNSEHWNFDIKTVMAHGNIYNEVYDVDKIFYQPLDSATMIGLQATGHYGQTTMQFLVAPYLIDAEVDDAVDNSLYASAWLGHSWQIKNWSIHASVGLEYRSSDILDYYYGISPEEATANFGQYQASSGIDLTTQISASYPISEDWLFESYLRYTDLADSISDSPVMRVAKNEPNRAEAMTEVGVLISYVF